MTIELITEIMKKSLLFQNLKDSDLVEIINDPNTKINVYEKGAFVFEENEKPKRLFILLSGEVAIIKSTCAGKRMLISQIEKEGEIFGEVYLFMEKQNYEVQAEVVSKTVILELENDIFFQNYNSEMNRIDGQLRNNMLKIFAMKAYQMNRKVRILGCASVREKIAVYLLDRQNENKSEILVPGREEMADYLNVTRPSLSRELINMSNENMIKVDGRKISILNQELLEDYL